MKVKRLICNLLTGLPNHDGGADGTLLIATTDTGLPAILLAIPADVAKGRAISLEASRIEKIDGKNVKIEYSTTAESKLCEETCKYMLPLDPRLVFLLNAGESASIFVPAKVPILPPPTKKTKKMSQPKANLVAAETPKYTISGDGFAEALKASTQGW